ncbi:dorsal-ventral patterning protein Sog [Anoplophora glabripennis]|nr:dorsal-ventral patterning protein Sog [Anoplophora glabripennis]
MTAFSAYLVVVFVVLSVASARNKSPLIDEEHVKTRNKAAECVFGKQVRELGSQWIPDLGVPIGVLYCMKCECIPFQRKRRIVARVQCRSIKNECPEPTCEEPVLLPGRCCKSCPGDTYSPDVIQDIVPQNIIEEEEKSVKHYAALLTGRSSLVLKNEAISHDYNKNNVVATGRFTFHKKNLHYSFYISEKAARPRSLHFLDSEGNILEDFTLSHPGGLVTSLYQNATRKVCGVWKRLPKDYRRMLKQEKMYVVLIWGAKDAEFTLSGQLMRYVALATEQFSSLLEPAPGTDPTLMAGTGGTAIVSISTSVSSSLHIAIIFNGLFSRDEILEVLLNVTLTLDEKKQTILQEDVRVHKPATNLNLVELSSPVTQAQLRLLTRGRLLLSISSASKPEALRLSGNVITKATCELFQTTLSSNPSDHNGNPYGTSGLAWMYLNNQGSLIYSVQIDSLPPKQYPIITLVDLSTKRRTELEDLTPYFHDGWANGTLDKLSPKILEPLYNGKLDVNVAVSNYTAIHGRLISKPVADARDAAAPILLKRENYTLPASAVGLAWISVDSDCHIHYDVTVSGLGTDKKLDLDMELYPMIAPGAPFISKHLEEFQDNQVEGSPVEALTKEELSRLDSGVNFIKVKERDTKVILLTAIVTKVKVPPPCRAPYTDNNVPTLFDHPEVVSTGECFYEDKFYKEETSWVSSREPCKMCFCQNGVPKCDIMTCPQLDCPTNNVTVRGECCPVCVESLTNRDTTPQKCIFNGRTYSPGSKFNPFLIPTGFDRCTECECDAKDLEIKCTRLNDNEKTCCKNCNKSTVNVDNPMNDDQVPLIEINYPPSRKEMSMKSAELVLMEGGCKNLNNPVKPYHNGSEYHPFIDSLGEYKCVTCKCQNGTPKCQRQHCDSTTCKRMIEMRRKKITINTSDFCCSLKECRKLRHRKNRKPHNS